MNANLERIPTDAPDRFGQGYAWFGETLRLQGWNARFVEHNAFPADLITEHVPLESVIRFRAERGDYGEGDTLRLVAQQLAVYQGDAAIFEELRRVGERLLHVLVLPIPQCGVIEVSVEGYAGHAAERSLREAEERFDHVMRAINEGVYDWNLEDGTVYYSERVREALSLSPEELRTQADWGNRIHPGDLPFFRAAYVAHVKGETERFECDYRYRAHDGSWRWARQHGLALRDGSGHALRMIGSTGDITRLKQAELELDRARTALEEQNTRLRAEIQAHGRSRATIEYLVDEIRGDHSRATIVGQSSALHALKAEMELVATTDATVLILGETGTGKELVARVVHELSSRSDKPMVKLNCATLPRDLIESELFGHEKGAFTGATQLRRGRFELADGGTLFLDEVGELPPDAQAKLLRVLQEQEFERVGGGRSLRTDVRVIAATNRNLGELVHKGGFRSDLYYRLNVFPLRIPPLRERREDIPLLIEHLLGRLARRDPRIPRHVEADFIDQAMAYDWPGNVRELENTVERAAILSKGGRLQLHEPLAASPTLPVPVEDVTGKVIAQPLCEVERMHIQRMLALAAGIVEGPRGAARILGLKPSTLRARMRKLGVGRSGPTAG